MSELAKCRDLVLWLQTLEATITWIGVHRNVWDIPVADDQAHLRSAELRKYETIMGHNLLTLIGDYEFTEWDEEDLPRATDDVAS